MNNGDFFNKKNENNSLDNISFLAIYNQKLYRNFKIEFVFGYDESKDIFESVGIELYSTTTGISFKKLYDYDKKSNFNLGVLFSCKIKNSNKVFSSYEDMNFSSNSTTVFL